MANMSYCRFRNTAADLRDCYDSMDEDVSADEAQARRHIIGMCVDIALDYGHEIGREVEAVE